MSYDDDINAVRGFLDGVEGEPERSDIDAPNAYREGYAAGRFARPYQVDLTLNALRTALPEIP